MVRYHTDENVPLWLPIHDLFPDFSRPCRLLKLLLTLAEIFLCRPACSRYIYYATRKKVMLVMQTIIYLFDNNYPIGLLCQCCGSITIPPRRRFHCSVVLHVLNSQIGQFEDSEFPRQEERSIITITVVFEITFSRYGHIVSVLKISFLPIRLESSQWLLECTRIVLPTSSYRVMASLDSESNPLFRLDLTLVTWLVSEMWIDSCVGEKLTGQFQVIK